MVLVCLAALTLPGCGRASSTAAVPDGSVPGARQDLTFSGALTGHWASARVTQCRVESAQGSRSGPVPVFALFMQARLDGAKYDLTLSISHYPGPGGYQAWFEPFPSPLPPDPGPSVSPFVPHVVPVPSPTPDNTPYAYGNLFLHPPSRDHARLMVPDNPRSTVTVFPDGKHGTIRATFAKVIPPGFQSPVPGTEVHVSGAWSCSD